MIGARSREVQHGDPTCLGRVGGEDRPDAQGGDGADDVFGGDPRSGSLCEGGFKGAVDDTVGGCAFFIAVLAHRCVLFGDGLQLEPDALGAERAAEKLRRALRKLDRVEKDRAKFGVVMLHNVEQHPVEQACKYAAVAALRWVARRRDVHHAAWRFLSSRAATEDPSSPALAATVRP
jgi:hypothetical protein